MSKLYVQEIYTATGQGEGLLLGVPCTFVRMNACDVGCSWCDTKYTWKRRVEFEMETMEVIKVVDKMSHWPYIVISGGEPLNQDPEGLSELLNKLAESYHVTIETSGTDIVGAGNNFLRTGFTWEQLERISDTLRYHNNTLLWSVSPKLSSANAKLPAPDLIDWYRVAARCRNFELQFKFVINVGDDSNDYEECLQQVSNCPATHLNVILQPMTDIMIGARQGLNEHRNQMLNSLEKLQEKIASDVRWSSYVRSMGATVVVRPQMHSILFGNKRLV